ncbi:CDC42 small effector protein 2 isoform X2 [Osmerus mordax]
MIGEPTNFVHTAHVGSGDLFSGMNSKQDLINIAWAQAIKFVINHLASLRENALTWHRGCRDGQMDHCQFIKVNSIQNQMQSKGGYEGDAMPVNVQLQLVDTKAG